MEHPIRQLIKQRQNGKKYGLYSVCCADRHVIKSCMLRAYRTNTFALIESTANQVNQYGGYTKMRPKDYVTFVRQIAQELNFPIEKLILGGDHLGPLLWSDQPEKEAMDKACELVRQYVEAGFTKIHIDTSMKLADDTCKELFNTSIIADRAALLARTAEEAFCSYSAKHPEALHPVYVIGSEVPIPGGAMTQEEGQITDADDFITTMNIFHETFRKYGLDSAWDYVVAVVVQPGVEFGDTSVNEYDHEKARKLCNALLNFPGLVFEGHSTDYQTPQKLREMVEDGIAILKVGPALTFSLREGLLALNLIESELLSSQPARLSRMIEVLDNAMLKNPSNWIRYYRGDAEKQRLALRYSYSDRCRYYLHAPDVSSAVKKLISNLSEVEIPMTLVSQYLPVQYRNLRNGLIDCTPEGLLLEKIAERIDDYLYAVTGKTPILY